MGNNNQKVLDQTDKKVVLVIGGGFAGIECAKAVEKKTNCALIDRKDYFFYNVGALRGVVNEPFVKKICIPYNKLLTSGSVVKGDVTHIGEKSIRIHGQDREINFDYLVIATGTSYAFPAKVPLDNTQDLAKLYTEVRGELASSKNIVIIGGGPVGIELAGEIVTTQKDKKVTIIQSGASLLSNRSDLNEKLKNSLQDQLEKLGVEMLFGERVDFSCFGAEAWKERYLVGPIKVKTEKGKEIDADLVFFCHGSHINSAAYSETLQNSMSDRGELRVNNYLQVEGHENIFAVGDCCNADYKMAFLASEQGSLVASNILAHIEGKPMKKHAKGLEVMIIPIGATGGASQLPLFGVVGATPTSILKGGDMFVSKTWASLNYSKIPDDVEGEKVGDKEEEKKKNLMAALGCGEEEADEVQKGLLPVKEVQDHESHI